jgi:cyanophycinase
MAHPSRPGAARPGHLLIIGGAEEKLRQRQILSRFASSRRRGVGPGGDHLDRVIARRRGDRPVSVPLRAARHPDVIGLRPITREEANDPALAAQLAETTGIFMTGGNQLRLSSVIGGTALGRADHRAGTATARSWPGTSAGASAISSHMVAFGTSGTSPEAAE